MKGINVPNITFVKFEGTKEGASCRYIRVTTEDLVCKAWRRAAGRRATQTMTGLTHALPCSCSHPESTGTPVRGDPRRRTRSSSWWGASPTRRTAPRAPRFHGPLLQHSSSSSSKGEVCSQTDHAGPEEE